MRDVRVLILGGTRFVGRAVAVEAVNRGWTVTLFHRGVTRQAPEGVESVLGDRTVTEDRARLAGGRWDLVVDTWEGAPKAVLDSAELLRDAAARYVYVSSRSVYRRPWSPGLAEDAPLVDAAADQVDGTYAECKAGGEAAARSVFGARALLVRPGLILGPGEVPARLVWWLRRCARGGDVLAPEPRELRLQYIDVRDLAGWVLDAAQRGLGGAFNVVSRPGHTTMEDFLAACAKVTGNVARLCWVAPERVLQAGVEPWTQLPVWIPPGHPLDALFETNVDKAVAAGLRCRPIGETVADTWDWLRTTEPHPGGLDPAIEAAILGQVNR